MNTINENNIEGLKPKLDEYLISVKHNELIVGTLPIFLTLLDSILENFHFTNGTWSKKTYQGLSKIDLNKKISIISNYYDEYNIDFNITEYIRKGIVCFNTKKSKFIFNDKKRYVLVPNNNLVIDIPIIIHECSHFMDYENGIITAEKDLFTESLAYTYELISLSYLYNNNYAYDSLVYTHYLFDCFYNFSKQYQPLFKMLTLYEKFNNISEKEYSLYFDDNSYNSYIQYLNIINNKNIDIIECCKYIFGICISIYIYLGYMNNNITIEEIKTLCKKVNNSTIKDCMNIIGLNYFTDKDIITIANSLKEISDYINSEKKNKVYHL